ncbi:MAG TPA: hypothetical protein VGJ26_06165, partial [Pirellulales bacterium]
MARRDVLRFAALAGCAAFSSTTGATGMSAEPKADEDDEFARKSGAIDAHVHVWTPDTKKYPLAAGHRRDEMKPASFTPEELWKLARPCGVSRVVLVQMSFYG